MSENNGFVTRKELDKGLVRRFGDVRTTSGRRWRFQTLSEGELARIESFIAQLPGLAEAARPAAWKRINEEGRQRLLQVSLVDGDGYRLFSDGDEERQRVAELVGSEDAQELFDAVQSHVGLANVAEVSADIETTVKNLLRTLVAGSQ